VQKIPTTVDYGARKKLLIYNRNKEGRAIADPAFDMFTIELITF
jgi:hypothetical protein